MLTRPSRRAVLALPVVLAAHAAAAQPDEWMEPPRGAVRDAQRQAWIDAFTGWASPHGGMLYARVHRGLPQAPPQPAEASYLRLRQSIQALEVAALPRAAVELRGVPGLRGGQADDNGFLQLPLPAGLRPGPLPVTLTLATAGVRAAPATIEVQVFDDEPGLGLLSDIDDTLTDTGVTHKLRMIKNTLLRSAWEVRTFPDAPAVVTALAGAGAARRPTFYLSGSPWGLHGRLAAFFARSGFPRAPLLLRRYSQDPLDAYRYKLPRLRALFAAFPRKRWVLLGDSGEKDPEVYATLRQEHDGAVAATYIHLVTPEAPESPRFAGALAFRDYAAVLRDAIARGLTIS